MAYRRQYTSGAVGTYSNRLVGHSSPTFWRGLAGGAECGPLPWPGLVSDMPQRRVSAGAYWTGRRQDQDLVTTFRRIMTM